MSELGNKHVCPDCGTKYYDLGASKPACPNCGTDPDGNPAEAPAEEADGKAAEATDDA